MLRKFRKRATTILLLMAMVFAMATPALAVPGSTDDPKWKYLRLTNEDTGDVLAESFYVSEVNIIHKPYAPSSGNATLSFVLEYGQPVNFELYYEDEFIGYIAQDVIGAGCRGDLPPPAEESDGSEEPEEPPFVYTVNSIEWDGTVMTEDGRIIFPDTNDDDELDIGRYNFKIVLQPTSSGTAKYKSTLEMQVDYTAEGFAAFAKQFIASKYLNNLHVDDVNGEDPINMVTGNFSWSYTDLEVYGNNNGLAFSRTYNSRDTKVGALGKGWRSNFDYSLIEHRLFTEVFMPDGFRLVFKLNFDGSYDNPDDANFTLWKNGDTYILGNYEGTEYYFDSNGQLTEMRLPYYSIQTSQTEISNGKESLFLQYTSDKLTGVSDSSGKSIAYEYSGDLLASASNLDGDAFEYGYDTNGYLSSITDLNGDIYLENTYDSIGRVTSQWLADRGTSHISYDTNNRVSTLTRANGAVVLYRYDKRQRLTEIEDSAGTVSYSYDSYRDYLDSVTDRLGNTTYYTYDHLGKNSRIEYQDGTLDEYAYDGNGWIFSTNDKSGEQILFNYYDSSMLNYSSGNGEGAILYDYLNDGLGNVIGWNDPLGNTWSFNRTESGALSSETDPLGNYTEYVRDSYGRITQKVDPDGGSTFYEYTPAGKLTAITDKAGNTTLYSYNGNGYVTEITDPMGYTTAIIYDKQNKPISVTDPEGNTTSYEYDSVGQLVKITDALGGETVYAYDLAGRMISSTDALGNTWQYTYDAEGQLLARTDPLGGTESFSYYPMGKLDTYTDANGIQTVYEQGTTMQRAYDGSGNYEEYHYTANGDIASYQDNRQNSWHYIYDANNRLTEAVDSLGNSTLFEYDGAGRLIKTTTPLGAETVIEYDSVGNVTAKTDPNGNETTFEHDAMGRLTKTTYADGTFATNTYYVNGWLASSTAPDGGATSYTYNMNGQPLTITDAMGGVTTFEYDALGRLLSATDAEGNVVGACEYDANGNVLSEMYGTDSVVEYGYDELNRLVSITKPGNAVSGISYDARGNVVAMTYPDGGTAEYEYDSFGWLSSYIDPEGYGLSYARDANGNATTMIDGNGNVKQTWYDELNRAINATDGDGNSSITQYDADGRVVFYRSPGNAETTYEYDPNGNLTKITDALGNETEFAYDNMNRVASATDALGAETSYAYTAAGYIESVTDALGGVKQYEYDLNGNVLGESDELGKTTSYEYDLLNRLTEITNPLGYSYGIEYDGGSDRITMTTDTKGNMRSFSYDNRNNLSTVTDALGNLAASYSYDSMDRLVTANLARINEISNINEILTTEYKYDLRGLLTKEIGATGLETVYTYDGNGNLSAKTDADGYTAAYGYNAKNLAESINYSDGRNVELSYNGDGGLIGMEDWNGETTFSLDLLGRILSANDHNSETTSYTYDAVGNKTGMTYPDGFSDNYAYDLLGRLTSMTDAEGKQTSYGYDAASQLINMNYPNGWKEFYTYDDAGQLKCVLDINPKGWFTQSLAQEYWYDSEGNVIKEFKRGTGGQLFGTSFYNYDELNRLVSAAGIPGIGAATYQYDSLGNLIKESAPGAVINYTYNDLNQLSSRSVNGSTDVTNYSYDNRGNLIKATKPVYSPYGTTTAVTEEYIYDSTNRLSTGVNAFGETNSYVYNGLGYRVGNVMSTCKDYYGYYGFGFAPVSPWFPYWMYGWCWPIGGGTPDPEWPFEGIVQPSSLLMQTVEKSYVLDYTSANKDVILEKENDGLALKYNYGLEKVSAMISGPVYGPCNLYVNGKAKVFYHEDSMGSTEYISDDFGGNILSYINYDPWGIPTNKATVMLGLRDVDLVAEFTGHPFDHVLGMYFAEARMYDAGDRRFAAADPMFGDVADPTSLNPYVYVLDNPLKWVDPLGLEKAVVSLMGSNLSATVDTDSMDSVIEMLNVFTYADKRWFFGDEAWVYSFDKEKIFNINFREGMSVKDVFSTVGLSEGTAGNGHDEIYFIKVICLDGVAQYQVVGPELGSDAYNKMVSSAKLYTNNGVITESAIERVMKDVYAWKDIDSISDGNFKSLGEFFSALVVDSGQWLNMNVNVHYFRNILNRVPTNIEEIITNKDDWTLLGLDDSAYHMYGDGGEFNLKFVSNDGHYEAVFMPTNYDAVKNTANWWEDYSNWKLVGSETELEQANMGTYNFSLKVPVTKVENITHGLYDVYPYQFSGYGNTENMPYSKMKELGYTGLDEGKERFRNNLNAILSRLSFSWKVNH